MHWSNIITTAAALSAAVATVWLATATKKLATGTDSLVQTTKLQGEQSASANQRSYALTLRQIDLQSKSNVYEDTLRYFYDDFLMIQEMASALGLSFTPKAYGNKLPFDQKTSFRNSIINGISLHGSILIGSELESWIRSVISLHDLLEPYMSSSMDIYGNRQPTRDPQELINVTDPFAGQFDSLKNRYAEIMLKMREELHPAN